MESQEWREIIYILAFSIKQFKKEEKLDLSDGISHMNLINLISQLPFYSVHHNYGFGEECNKCF
jgi:hypothetical protein